jgi:hypothetical protein
MTSRVAQLNSARRLRHQPFVLDQVTAAMRAEVASWSNGPDSRGEALRGIMRFLAAVPPGSGCTVQQWWDRLGPELLPQSPRINQGTRWPAAVRAPPLCQACLRHHPVLASV